VTDIQPQGQGFRALRQAFDYYSGLRQLGLNVDIIPPGRGLDGYAMVVIPCLPIVPDGFADQLSAFNGQVLIGPRSGSKTADFAIPATLAPGPLQPLIAVKATRAESLRPGLVEPAGKGAVQIWLEHIESDLAAEWVTDSGHGICYRDGSTRYIAAGTDGVLLHDIMARACNDAGLPQTALGDSLRVRRNGDLVFVFNYGTEDAEVAQMGKTVIGQARIPPAGTAIFTKRLAK
jgi:beta-galactosidase